MGIEGRAAALCAALLVGASTGCSGHGSGPGATSSVSHSPATDETAEVAESGGRVGPAGSACELPVSFDVASGWKAKAVDGDLADAGGSGESEGSGDRDDELAREITDALLRQGPVTAACEIDAKPAGHIGFLRVWTGGPGAGDARTVLEGFVAAEDGARKPTYRTLRTGGLDGVEVTYLVTSELLDETKKQRALAVAVPGGPVVVHLGGLDDEEHEGMLPAYELAKDTLRAT